MKRICKMALITALLVFITPVAFSQVSGVSSHPMIGDQAPVFDLEEAGGGTLGLESLKGRYVVLHFGASW